MTTRRANATVHPDLLTALRANLDAALEEGLTRADVYAAMGYRPTGDRASPALSRMIHGHRDPTPATIAAFVQATGRPLRFMLDGVTVEYVPGPVGDDATRAA